MWRILKAIGFIIGWLGAFAVVYVNHVMLVDAGYDVDMFGLLLILVITISIIKSVDKKVEVWTIQDKNKTFIIVWTNAKKILIAIFLTWILYTIEDDIVKIQWSGVLITACFIVGFVFSLLGELARQKTKKHV